METPDQSWISRKLRDAAIGLDKPHEQARAIILAAVAINAGMGAVPFGINMLSFMAVDATMVALVGSIYGFTYTHEQAAALVKSMFTAVTFSTAVYLLAFKVFAESAKASGAVGAVPFVVAGVSMDVFLCGALTYAIGFTSKTYFEREARMSQAEMQREFNENLRKGKGEMKARNA